MKTSSRILHLLPAAAAAVAVLIVAGCVKEMENLYNDGETIAFTARMSDEATKASPVTQLSGEAGVIGYAFDTWTEALTPLTAFTEKTFTFDGDILSQDGEPVKWNIIDKSRLRTYAYAPKNINGATVNHTAGTPTITYTVPSDVAEQTDIITAVNEVSKDFRQNIPLTFDHALTAVKFKAGFDCKVNSVTVSDVAAEGTLTMGGGWSGQTGNASFTISFTGGKTVRTGEMITDNADGNVMFMIPQTFAHSTTARITLNYDDNKTISTSLADRTWEQGKMITYTLRKTDTTPYIYFDLTAGNVTINGSSYSGKVFINNGTETHTVSGTHSNTNRYYVYQSSPTNKTTTGWSGTYGTSTFTLPEYDPVKVGDILWRDWIVDNTDVEGVINAWCNSNYKVATDVGRGATPYYITITGNLKCNLTIDNLFSTAQHTYGNGTEAGIRFTPSGNNSELTINITGDNRFGNVRYWNGAGTPANNGNKIIFEGKGSLTVADVVDDKATNAGVTGHYGNHFNSAIGATDHGPKGSDGIVINSGIIFAGTTAAENSSAIGGGGNGVGVVTINGGTVTAVAHTTGTAIGGGIGFSSGGGPGYVEITGGNVYAYNLENPHGIPSAAIGGAGSSQSIGAVGNVKISGGNIYAQAVGGTAIGGGSSKTTNGGEGIVTISGGTIIAKSVAGKISGSNSAGAGIGGGTGGSNSGANGGTATITISGNPIIRTGSIGGGKTNNSAGTIGSADIRIHGGDIQAQFVMAAGAATKPKFFMNGGTIRNSYTDDQTYRHVQDKGGAVYLEDGTVTIEGGTIRNCSAEAGGAIYIEGSAATSFTMTGGTIRDCISDSDGGALYLKGGTVTLSGGTLQNNLAQDGNGGAVYIEGGDFRMTDKGTAKVTGNAAFNQTRGGNGGGIFVTSKASDVTVDILSGSITGNSSDRYGGGISVDMLGYDDITAKVTVGKAGNDEDNPDISGNRTLLKGGGLFARGPKADITINSGKIMDNSTSGYVANADVANEGGMVKLNGGQVTHVTVTYNNNEAYYNKPDLVETRQQKIVTATNSTMTAPTDFEKLGYILDGWNTRPDGKGTSYTDGQILNISSDITLYAQWTLN